MGIALLAIIATGPALITLPLSGNYRVTQAGDGSFAGTTSICDINNPVNCVALGQQTKANSVPVVLPSDQVPLQTNTSQLNAVTVDTNSGNKSPGTQRVVLATDQPTMSNPQPVNINNSPTVTVSPNSTLGWTPSLQNALSTTVKSIKASAGTLGSYYCWNPNAAVAYVQIFDASSVTLGTTVPKWSIGIPPTGAANLEMAVGLHFGTAIQVAATTTATGLTANASALDCNFGFN